MGSWREAILREFTPQAARLTLVADPDGLLLEEGILKGIEERGFELIPFDDHVAFRYAYESRYRARWDREETTDLVVVLRAEAADLDSLPYDLLQAGRRLAFNLADLFPNLDYPVVALIGRADIQALYEAQERQAPGRLGPNATKDFALLHVFGVAPELLRSPSDLLRTLLRRHHQGRRLPAVLDDRLITLLRREGSFQGWPLETIVPDREAFFAFLQERWPIFLDCLAADASTVRENDSKYGLEIPGPADLPFEHDDVRVVVDNLFLEGMLQPVSHPSARAFQGRWASVGVQLDAAADRRRRWVRLLEAVAAGLPGAGAPHQEWQAFAPKWAELIVLCQQVGRESAPEEARSFDDLRARVDDAFAQWIHDRFGTLHNQPPLPPVMVHHIPRLLARALDDDRDARAALVVMDGLSLDQWIVARDVLRAQRPALRLREHAAFAWVPTLTSVSRQACFAGRPPLYFPASIHSTDREGMAWKRFWEDAKLDPDAIGYERSIRDHADLERVDRLVSHPKVRIAGLVVDKVDKIMHGMQLGLAGMHNQVRQWTEQGTLASLLDLLVDRGFMVVLTADHGNLEAVGTGRPAEGVTAEVRGERARIFSDASLRARVNDRFPECIAWPPIGLPDDYLALLAPRRTAFVKEEERLVGHGGVSVEEVIVPLIVIERAR